MIKFTPVTTKDYDLLYKWLNTGNVLKWYGYGKTISKEEVAQKYSPTKDLKTKKYIIHHNNQPIGFIKTYMIRDYPDYFKHLGLDDNPSAFDIFIADEFQGKGLAVQSIKKFIEDIIFDQKKIERIVIGPAESNTNAIKAYSKVGFKFLKLVKIPDEKEQEYLMELIKATYISIDIGGTNIRVAKCSNLSLLPEAYTIIHKNTLTHNYDADFDALLKLLKAENNIKKIVIGLAGRINLPEWQNKDYLQVLKDTFNCDVICDNDATVASYGQNTYEHSFDSNYVYLTWGTGIGGVTVSKQAKKLSITKLDWELYRKDFESLCGGKNLELKYKKPLAELNNDEWNEVFINFKNEIIRLSRQLNYKDFVIGGGATSKQIQRMEKLSLSLSDIGINLVVSKLGDDIGLLGGFAIMQQSL